MCADKYYIKSKNPDKCKTMLEKTAEDLKKGFINNEQFVASVLKGEIPMTAIEKQVGGDHYKNMAYQPVDLIKKLGLGFFGGSVLKYISRYQYKNGVQDLDKAIHLIELAKEKEIKEPLKLHHDSSIERLLLELEISKYCLTNRMGIDECQILFTFLVNIHNCCDGNTYDKAVKLIGTLRDQYEATLTDKG